MIQLVNDLQVQDCIICLQFFPLNKVTLACQHIFHEHCLAEWTTQNNNCPICRRTVVKVDTDELFINELNGHVLSLRKIIRNALPYLKNDGDRAFALNPIEQSVFLLQEYLTNLRVLGIFKIKSSDTLYPMKLDLVNLTALRSLKAPIDRLASDVETFGVNRYYNAHKIMVYQAVMKFLEIPRLILGTLKEV